MSVYRSSLAKSFYSYIVIACLLVSYMVWSQPSPNYEPASVSAFFPIQPHPHNGVTTSPKPTSRIPSSPRQSGWRRPTPPKPVVVKVVHESLSANQALGKKMAAAVPYHWTGSQWDALKALWNHESGWSTDDTNSSSGACGIPQRHPCNGLSSQPAGEQIAWGLQYIKGRYANPVNAHAHWRSHNWY